jgi:hypothetical protein
MNKLVIVAFFGLLFQGICRTQCIDLSASNFPRLPTDIIGALPAEQQSVKLRQLFLEARDSAKKPIRFTELPIGVPNTSAVETTKDEEVVALRQGLDHKQKENAIAHELLHIILQGEGFAALGRIPDTAAPLIKELGFTITSCVDDSVVDKRLAARGFEPQVLNHDTAEQLRLHPPTYLADRLNDPIVRDGNALLIVCFNFRLKYPSDQIENTWLAINPDIVARAHALAFKVGNITCNDAQTCFEQKQHIRDVLGYPITFCNPQDGKFE